MLFRYLLLLVPALLCRPVQVQPCTDSTQKVKMYVNSYRNSSGHLITQFRVDRDGDTVPTQLEIEVGTSSCSTGDAGYLLATIAAPLQPRSDYELFPGVGRYKLHTEGRVWEEAKRTCEREVAHLGVLDSELELRVMQDMYARHPHINNSASSDFVFLGYNDIVSEGTYVTIFGDGLADTGFSKWSPGQPNNVDGSSTDPGQDCIGLDRGRFLNDAWCYKKYAFFCEQALW